MRWLLAIPHYIVLAIVGFPLRALSLLIWAIPLLLLARALDIEPVDLGLTLVGAPPELLGRESDALTSIFSIPAGLWPGWALIILVTGTLPAWLFGYTVWLQRYAWNVYAYVLFHNAYPPFGGEAGAYAPVTYEVATPERYSRWLPLVKWLLLFPHYVVLAFLGFGVWVAYVGTWFAVLATGRYPHNLFEFEAGYLQWSARVGAYQQLITDAYPPYSFGRPVSGTVVALSLVIGVIVFVALFLLLAVAIIAAVMAGFEERPWIGPQRA